MRLTLLLIVAFFAVGISLQAQSGPAEPKLVKLTELKKIIESPGEEIRVINFWATWCGPCIKEMPHFEKLNAERKDIAVTLVSLDMDLDPNPDKVKKFVTRKKIASRVLILDEVNPNAWIDKIDPQWGGSLPATIVVNSKTGKRKFVASELHEGDLEKLIDQVK